ncbi:MAG: hypothetical protein ACO32I_07875, partial [Candidatus Limnocylindrus sp.]
MTSLDRQSAVLGKGVRARLGASRPSRTARDLGGVRVVGARENVVVIYRKFTSVGLTGHLARAALASGA